MNEFPTALDLLRQQTSPVAIVSFCEQIDGLFDGGVRTRQTVELVGAPGAGCTTLALQLAIDAAIPERYGGLASGAIFIDTECSFDARRAAAMAGALATHIAALDAQSATDNSAATTAAPTCDSILARIQVVRVHSFLELVKLVHALPHILRTNTPPVRLVVIDSVAAVARGDPTLQADAGERVRMLSALGARLRDVAVAGDAAVVVTNHVTVAAQTVALDGDESAAAGGNALVQCPALGDRWRHWCDTRVFLEFNGTTRTARLIKGGKDQTVTFSITDEGIRD